MSLNPYLVNIYIYHIPPICKRDFLLKIWSLEPNLFFKHFQTYNCWNAPLSENASTNATNKYKLSASCEALHLCWSWAMQLSKHSWDHKRMQRAVFPHTQSTADSVFYQTFSCKQTVYISIHISLSWETLAIWRGPVWVQVISSFSPPSPSSMWTLLIAWQRSISKQRRLLN